MDFTIFVAIFVVIAPLILVPLISYVLAGRVFRVKGRAGKIVVSLIISLAFASIIPFIIMVIPSMWGFSLPISYPIHSSFVFLWNDCSTFYPDPCLPPATTCIPENPYRMNLVVCKAVQYYEWVLIITAAVLMLASLAYDMIKKKKK